ncbi:MAG TPA: hypothetical protein VNO84_12580 [Burkholderiaceae bacterium]|nr:hypothetical protein [Burkholderiaceae bacterium]
MSQPMSPGAVVRASWKGAAGLVRWLSCAMLASMLAACAGAPKKDAEALPVSYEQLLEEGRQAQTSGDSLRAAQLWKDAARLNPTAKEPWLRLAQMHFDAGDYGQAITAAQEAYQRDSGDATASGLLAVSGLRVSSEALARLRSDNLTGSTRAEAEALAKTLREMLGTPVLVPAPHARPPAALPRSSRSTEAGSAAPGGARTAKSATPEAKPSPSRAPANNASNASRDPFSALR